jgi:periplasmic protein TonB
MGLRYLLFSTDKQTTALISQVLAGLSVEGESCSEGPAAVEQVTQHLFQIVIIDWDVQPEAGLLLTTARERKPAERPLTLAIVSDDVSVPKALQAGANSILRKPLLLNQVQETLKTARDLLRARESTAQAAAASAGSSPRPAYLEQGSEGLRAGEFLQSTAPAPGAQFVVESEAQKAFQQPATEAVSPLKDLEPMAAAVEAAPAAPPPEPDERRGLEWYLNRKAGPLPPVPQAAAAAAAPAPVPQKQPELIGFDQMPSHSPAPAAEETGRTPESASSSTFVPQPHEPGEQKAEEQLFAYIAEGHEPYEEKVQPRFGLRKKAIVGAFVLAGLAIAAAPQAPWHASIRGLWARGRQSVHTWLNPQPVTTPPAPAAHEDFARPGDEYQLPVAENIPDATTDPAQIRVTPIVDPTKKPSPDANGDQPAGDGTAATPGDQGQAPAVQVQENQPAQPANATAPPATGPAVGDAASPGSAAAAHAAAQIRSDTLAAASTPPQPITPSPLDKPAPPSTPLPHSVSKPVPTPGIPSSLKSQMASTTPDASGNKAPEAALPSIEPVSIPEATARGQLTDQPAIAYPANAKGQQGTVVLQLLIGRDGTVQDAKFLQGSLAFARSAIDGVKQWKFKPYMMNGRAVSVQTPLTISFKPGS